MRISDWSSDVCSSDLICATLSLSRSKRMNKQVQPPEQPVVDRIDERAERIKQATTSAVASTRDTVERAADHVEEGLHRATDKAADAAHKASDKAAHVSERRSEEHTSELPSIKRISYDDF